VAFDSSAASDVEETACARRLRIGRQRNFWPRPRALRPRLRASHGDSVGAEAQEKARRQRASVGALCHQVLLRIINYITLLIKRIHERAAYCVYVGVGHAMHCTRHFRARRSEAEDQPLL